MEHSLFYKEFKRQLNKQYSSSTLCPLPPVSPFVIPIEPKALQEITSIIKILYKMAHTKSYASLIQTEQTEYLNPTGSGRDTALLMAYDFHIDKEGHPKLIEVNTQASGYLVSELVDQVHFSAHPDLELGGSSALLKLKQSFEQEWKSFSGTNTPPAHTVIVDHQIPQQKMYVEFLMYKDLLNKQWQWPCQLMEIGDLHFSPEGFLNPTGSGRAESASQVPPFEKGDTLKVFSSYRENVKHENSNKSSIIDKQNKKVDMIYNRSTDFYFEKWPALKKAFLNQTNCISPHPGEYLLLADKARLVEWSDPHFLNQMVLNQTVALEHAPSCSPKEEQEFSNQNGISEEEKHQIQQAIPQTQDMHSLPAEELWKKRKNFFFKPKRSYGGKAVYRGKNISRKMFERVIQTSGLFQEAVPPPVFKDSSGEEWKYDIRAYVYRDEVQKFSARVYQGQVTGFQKPLSGFATITRV